MLTVGLGQNNRNRGCPGCGVGIPPVLVRSAVILPSWQRFDWREDTPFRRGCIWSAWPSPVTAAEAIDGPWPTAAVAALSSARGHRRFRLKKPSSGSGSLSSAERVAWREFDSTVDSDKCSDLESDRFVVERGEHVRGRDFMDKSPWSAWTEVIQPCSGDKGRRIAFNAGWEAAPRGLARGGRLRYQ